MTDPLTTQIEIFASTPSTSARYSAAVPPAWSRAFPQVNWDRKRPPTRHFERTARATLAKLSDHELFAPIVDSQAACLLAAGLWLGYDFLEESHSIGQAVRDKLRELIGTASCIVASRMRTTRNIGFDASASIRFPRRSRWLPPS
jgi:hypothetical protein